MRYYVPSLVGVITSAPAGGPTLPVRTKSGILYRSTLTWYKAVQDGMYWYEPVRTLLDTRPYEKPQNGTYQYVTVPT